MNTMTRRLPVLVGAFAASVSFASMLGTAEAGHVHFSGGVHWSGGVHVSSGVRWSRPAWQPHRWSVGGSIYVGSGYYYPRPYYYYPEYVPSYYGASYYPVAPALAAPGIAVAAVVRPELPRFGIGLFAGGVNVQGTPDSSDVGVIGRLRLTDGLLLEGELGKTSFQNDLRVDRRLGGSLIYEFGAYNRFAPYVLGGLGVQQADVGGNNYSTTQDFAELGVGIRYAITPHFHLALDGRAGTRSSVSNDQPNTLMGASARSVAPPTSDSGQSEDYTRVRLSALLYF
jgi:hypothetical protein